MNQPGNFLYKLPLFSPEAWLFYPEIGSHEKNQSVPLQLIMSGCGPTTSFCKDRLFNLLVDSLLLISLKFFFFTDFPHIWLEISRNKYRMSHACGSFVNWHRFLLLLGLQFAPSVNYLKRLQYRFGFSFVLF